MDFLSVFKFLVESLKRENIDFALVGGFALQAAGVTRSTRDIDLLILARDGGKVKKILQEKGYKLLHESPDILNFLGTRAEQGRVDFLLAHRKYALAMLQRARPIIHLKGHAPIKTITPEDIIGLKVQSSTNDPDRWEQDIADIKSLLRAHHAKLDMQLVREYFQVFEREDELDKILREAGLAPHA